MHRLGRLALLQMGGQGGGGGVLGAGRHRKVGKDGGSPTGLVPGGLSSFSPEGI